MQYGAINNELEEKLPVGIRLLDRYDLRSTTTPNEVTSKTIISTYKLVNSQR
jgi:hypothetical protein